MPCSRCAGRKLECTYDHVLTDSLVHETFDFSLVDQIDEVNHTFFDLDNDDLVGLGDLGHVTQMGIEGAEDIDDQIDILSLVNQSYLPRDLNPLQRAAITNTPIDRLNSTTNTGFLTRLRKTNPVAKHSANLVIDALCAIPEQMLRRATFPPFIHAHWHRQTLPEPLAVCMRIAQMFALRTPDVTPFIWRTILAEQRRFVEQVCMPLSREMNSSSLSLGISAVEGRPLGGHASTYSVSHHAHH